MSKQVLLEYHSTAVLFPFSALVFYKCGGTNDLDLSSSGVF
jgi:hypothetical protein